MKNLIISFSLLIVTSNILVSQVTEAKLGLNYHIDKDIFDVVLFIEKGSATTPHDRAFFSSAISIVVPIEANFDIVENINPLINNSDYSGTTATNYSVSSSVHNHCLDEPRSFYFVTPSLSPTCYFNDLISGSQIVLFSFKCDAAYDGFDNIRLFDSNIDPNSSAQCMGGGDFSNGISIGWFDNIYVGNVPTTYLNPFVEKIDKTCLHEALNIEINVISAPFQQPINLNWSGPNGFTSTSSQITVPRPEVEIPSVYELVIIDALDHESSIELDANEFNNGGEYYTFCSSQTIELEGIYPNDGTWTLINGHHSGLEFEELMNGKASLSGIQAGKYHLEYASLLCPDTIEIDVVDEPSNSIWLKGDTIEVEDGYALYKWYKCDTNEQIENENNFQFTPKEFGEYYAIIGNDNCISQTDCISIIQSTVIDPSHSYVKIYPNPAQYSIRIETETGIRDLSIIDVFGRKIKMNSINQDDEYELPFLPNGTYALEIITLNGSSTRRLLVIQK